MAMTVRDIVVVGASAGGVKALQALVGGLPADCPAAVFVVLHLPPQGISHLARILSRAGPLPAQTAQTGDEIRPGQIYVAPPDRHLLVRRGKIELGPGPKENGVRPAADTLFRSAAHAYRKRVVGIVLSGSLADGTAGLAVIKQLGGLAIVQDPSEAEYASMPVNALRNINVDYVVPAQKIGNLLIELNAVRQPVRQEEERAAVREDITDLELPDLEQAVGQSAEAGLPTGVACPACGGALWEKDEAGVKQYRCYLGHNYVLTNLLSEQWDSLEGALWNAVRTMRERAALLRRAADSDDPSHPNPVSRRYRDHADEFEQQATSIAGLLQQVSEENSSDA